MLYLIDANVLITANRDYYAIDQVPEFWDWLRYQGEQGQIKMPIEILEEVKAGRKENDPLLDWINDDVNYEALRIDEEVDPNLVRQVVDNGYAPDLTDDEVDQLGQDPFLIAYAMAGPDRCVVTTEVSKPSKQRQNRKIPDVCATFGVTSYNTFALTRALGFSTSWTP